MFANRRIFSLGGRKCQDLFRDKPCSILHRLTNIFHFKFRICFQHILSCGAGCQHFQDNANRYPHSPNGRLTEA